jgi:hypothetical protein
VPQCFITVNVPASSTVGSVRVQDDEAILVGKLLVLGT